MSFTFGNIFRVTIFGESHGKAIGAVVDGCPAGIPVTDADIQAELDRRRPGQPLSTGRREKDAVKIVSGTFNGRTSGGPVAMVIENTDVDSSWYEENRFKPRPGHGDYTVYMKYHGFNDYRGGGFLSGRLTACTLMGGAIAKKLLSACNIKVLAHVVQIGNISVEGACVDDSRIEAEVAASPVRCADKEKSEQMVEEIMKVSLAGDSVGGVIECRVLNLPVGLGEPVFDSLESVISHGIFSIPAVKAVEFGAGFKLSGMKGSESNDSFYVEGRKVSTRTNNSGGILGGISSGMPLIFRVGLKPTPSICAAQRTVDLKAMEETELRVEGRHDPCVVPRAVPVAEAITSICIADLLLRSRSQSMPVS